ncbi:MAG: CDP-2,3-bis-(O-geranylgeranyl)-sn-glycerol synthase [Candidatus Micrarchaeia archaeon]
MQFSFIYYILIYPIIYILPAYVSNGAPVLFGGGKPLDMNAKFHGKRIFGDHKTIRGTISALLSGIIIGIIEYPFFSYMLAIALLLSIGTITGDLLGSFIKRRLSFDEGKSFPIMDQYGFFVFALIFALPLGHLPSLYGLLFLVVLTGLLHISTNIGAYKLKLKKVPW